MNNNQGGRSAFSGKIGYVLAVAGSAVGLGNIWRFPYLAARHGGGMFLLVYLVLMLTFGYTMIMAETTIGRMTRKSPVGAFSSFGGGKALKMGGWFNAVIPMLIVPYYSVIGGWVCKYLFEYLRGGAKALAQDACFTAFLSDPLSMEIWFVVFSAATLLIIMGGVKKGVERVSRVMMPLLVVLAVVVSLYSVTRPGAMAGVRYLFIPDLSNFSLMTVVAAMGQMFYSLSIAMGILYTYGSYIEKDVDIEKATTQVEIFDTAIAILAGLMIIPAVFAFSGGDASVLTAGPSLMFITIPKVFDGMGLGTAAGILFFTLVLFAALTSSISLAETSVSTLTDELGMGRNQACLLLAAQMLVFGTLSVLGFSALEHVTIFGMSILDFFDFLTNSIMMPVAAMLTCYLVIRVVGVKAIADEVEVSSKFSRKRLFNVCIRYLAPVCLAVILISSLLSVLGVISM